MIDRQYFTRQAATLLKIAQSTNDPNVAGALVEKAAEFNFQVDKTAAPQDRSPSAPDVEPGA